MEENRKLRVGIVSNCPVGGKTGLARNMKEITKLLHKTGKYELFFLAQQMSDNDPNFQKLPFKCEGVFKDFNQEQFQKDPGYQRAVCYGNMAVKGFVENNRLDCLICSDDIWGFQNSHYLDTEWFKHIKKNFLPIITADSEPLLPQIVEWAEKCENMKFWSSFAERILKKKDPEKYKHCGVIYGAMNIEAFKPLPESERLQLRKKFNIKEDEKIIIYLGRNQLRKIFASHIEGLNRFKKKYPEKKVRLLFHCSWSEPGGWPLNQIREQNELNKEDILTTYYCRNCQDWNVQPYEGEDLNCPCCNGQRTRVTAGVGSTINEEDLNKIYNLADGSASIYTSGSFELTNAESMLAGVPLANPNYVCGEDFLSSGAVYEIKGTHTWEHATGFRKFVPDIDSVCEFFKYIYDLSNNEKQKIVRKGRKWAIDNFDAKNVVKKYEEFLDSRQPINWEPYFNKKIELKNVQAQIEDKQSDDEFILECYTKILLNPEVKINDSNGFNHWKNFLSQPKDKNQLKNEMVNVFRNAAVEHNQKVQPPITLDQLLIKNNKKHFLIVCPESAGDIFYVTSTLESFRESYPKEEWNIYFACKKEFIELLYLNPNVDKILEYHPMMESEINMTGMGGNPGIFNGYAHATILSQRQLSYLTNNNLSINIKK
jgi:glycosyltransferase involved in cell wall biosynthesis